MAKQRFDPASIRDQRVVTYLNEQDNEDFAAVCYENNDKPANIMRILIKEYIKKNISKIEKPKHQTF